MGRHAPDCPSGNDLFLEMIHPVQIFLALLASIVFMIGARPVHAETVPATCSNSCAKADSAPWSAPICGGGGMAVTSYTSTSQTETSCSYSWQATCVAPAQAVGYVAYTGSTTAEPTQQCTCPTSGGWTLGGNTCSRADCVGEQMRDEAGACVYPSCGPGQSRGGTGEGSCKSQCPDAGGKGSHTGETWKLSGKPSNLEVIGPDGCVYEVTSGACAGTECFFQIGRATGDAADDTAYSGSGGSQPAGETGPANPTLTPATDPADSAETACLRSGGCPIKINGNVTCSTCQQSTTVSKTATTNQNNEVVIQQTGIDTIHYDNGITETTTALSTTVKPEGSNSYTSGGAGAVTTSGGTTTSTQNQQSYCQQHPADPVCKSVAGSPTNTEGTKTDCEKNPAAAGCAELGTPENVEMTTNEIGVNVITPVSFGSSAATCPAPIPLPLGMQLPFTQICDAMGMIRPLILALAWLSAGMIVMGAFRNG